MLYALLTLHALMAFAIAVPLSVTGAGTDSPSPHRLESILHPRIKSSPGGSMQKRGTLDITGMEDAMNNAWNLMESTKPFQDRPEADPIAAAYRKNYDDLVKTLKAQDIWIGPQEASESLNDHFQYLCEVVGGHTEQLSQVKDMQDIMEKGKTGITEALKYDVSTWAEDGMKVDAMFSRGKGFDPTDHRQVAWNRLARDVRIISAGAQLEATQSPKGASLTTKYLLSWDRNGKL
ncbi:hypothetical protein FRB99_003431 [Tulasnella sp. 403]|nr:hypothetical protein FRB99_003431 [Tulasnella sp. 403]